MNNRQFTTLRAVFSEPPPANLRWTEAEALLAALGAEVTEGNGSRVRVALNGVRAVFHRPHPQPEMDRGAVRSLRTFLTIAGVNPEQN